MSEHELLPLYALGSLPEDERVAFEAHLGTCAECRRELASYEPALAHLATAAEEAPPPGARASVLAAIRETPQERPFAPPPVPEPALARSPATPPQRWLALAAAVLVFALVAVSATGLVLWRRTGELQQQVAKLQAASQMASVLAAEDAELIDFETELAGELRVAMAHSREAGMVVGDDLEAPPDDRAYQLWVLEDGTPRSAGMIAQRSGVLGELSDLGAAQGVAISLEPPAGSDAPTGPIVAQAEL